VPLVSVLFMASLLVPLLDPNLATIPGVVRAMVGITMFSAAYLAENVRGGLQSIPGGQEEAGKALGLNNVQVTSQIMLPQALRAVIPALVGQAISLFKDTSLVYIVGLADLTRVAQRVVAQSEFVGHRLETFTFVSVIYFIFSYVMSYVSRRIEESGSGSARR
jgi:general L-amino acid transport system permease protein